MYEYKAKVLKFVDGDTIHVQLDKGTDEFRNSSLRFYGLDTLETSTEEGRVAAEFTKNWLLEHGTHVARTDLFGNQYTELYVLIRTVKDRKEKYGRYLAHVYDLDGLVYLNAALLQAGHARPYLP